MAVQRSHKKIFGSGNWRKYLPLGSFGPCNIDFPIFCHCFVCLCLDDVVCPLFSCLVVISELFSYWMLIFDIPLSGLYVYLGFIRGFLLFFQALPLFIDLFTTCLKTVHSKRRRMFTYFSDCLCDIYLLFSTHGRGFWFVRRRHLLFISQYCMFIPTNDMLHICLISYCILLTVHSSSSSLFWLHVPWRINLTLLHI